MITQVRSQQDVKVIIRQFTLQGNKACLRQDQLGRLRCDDLLLNAVTPLLASANQSVGGDSFGKGLDSGVSTSLFFRHEAKPLGNNQAHIPVLAWSTRG
jgi:hypothetical protein